MVKADECVYVEDGGSFEIEAAKELGMIAVQAVLDLQDGTFQPSGRKENFKQIEKPLDVLNYI